MAARKVQLLERIGALKAEHPVWGDRRIRAQLRCVDGLPVNPKRVCNAIKANNLLAKPNPKLRAGRKANTSRPKPRPTGPDEW